MLKIAGYALGVLLGFLVVEAHAATLAASSCSYADVQLAINSASSGDTVQLPPFCVVTWTATVSLPSSKGITLDGNGAIVTRGVSDGVPLISLAPHVSVSSRITGFVFSDSRSAVGTFIRIGSGNETTAKFRIDHCSFTGTDILTHVQIARQVYGLIDHNTFTWSTNNEVIHNEAYGDGSTIGWTNDVFPGSDQALYIEDNQFFNQVSGGPGNPAYFWGGSAVQGYYGSRTVFRYNYVSMATVDMHGTPGQVGARWWEIYNNTFNIVPFGNQDKYIGVRGGSGVIFNNTKIGSTNDGGGNIELIEEDAGDNALYQIGRGKNQALDPAYVWGNDSSMRVVSGSSNVQENRDFFQSPKPGYVPYVYPHPLQGTSPPLAAPSNLRIVDE